MNGRQDHPTPGWSRGDTLALSLTTLAGVLVRALYVAGMDAAPHDPWRHLLLIRNLREGLGFTLFEGQPYIWYQPPWYWLCAAFPAALDPAWIAAAFSALCVPVIYLLARREAAGHGRIAAAAAATLAALYGPFVNYTCHYGPEAFALFLLLAALLVLGTRSGVLGGAVAGLLFGTALVLRMNYVFSAFWLLPLSGRPRRVAALGAGAALPLLAAWWRNHRVIAHYDWLFTWDGLATPARGFNPISTLLIQMHPDVAEGLRRLHAQIIPRPEWSSSAALLAFVLLAALCLALARRWGPALTFGCGVIYLVVFDGTGSSHFFRTWVGLFPAMFVGLGIVAARARVVPGRAGALAGAALLVAVLGPGLPGLLPPGGAAPTLGRATTIPLGMVTPPEGSLREERYMVNSTFFHPESLLWRFPERHFIGMPLDPQQFDDFRAHFPEYRTVLWHEVSVQDALRRYLLTDGGYRVVERLRNDWGRTYEVLSDRPDSRQPEAAGESAAPAAGPDGPGTAPVP